MIYLCALSSVQQFIQGWRSIFFSSLVCSIHGRRGGGEGTRLLRYRSRWGQVDRGKIPLGGDGGGQFGSIFFPAAQLVPNSSYFLHGGRLENFFFFKTKQTVGVTVCCVHYFPITFIISVAFWCFVTSFTTVLKSAWNPVFVLSFSIIFPTKCFGSL